MFILLKVVNHEIVYGTNPFLLNNLLLVQTQYTTKQMFSLFIITVFFFGTPKNLFPLK